MTTKKLKPVWRQNIGDPNNDSMGGHAVLYANGRIGNFPQNLNMNGFDWSIQGLWDDITYYQTTRTREAKHYV